MIDAQNLATATANSSALAGDVVNTFPNYVGDGLRSLSAVADRNPALAAGAAVVMAAGVGYLAYKAFSDKGE